ncbi:MAG: WD40-repeat-containing domain protein [Monoraphidium minutum]|nr:MAG: WD40-repeat-containing domain protein [Monoraphidium minutum]
MAGGSRSQVQYQAQLHSRVLVPVTAQRSRSQWLVGSTSLRDENELRLLEYDPEHEALTSVTSWVHPEEVWDAAPCPVATERVITVHSKGGAYGATLWRAEPGGAQLEPLARMEHAGVVRRVVWNALAPEVALTFEEGALRVWQMGPAAAQCVASAPTGGGQRLWGGAAHPKDAGLAAAVAGGGVQLWDVQNCAKVGEVPAAHRPAARCVDWAPHHEHRLVSCGDDCKLRFWDTRALGRGEPLLELGGHSHWVWAARFSPFHDQMLASASTDCTVALWYAPGLARARDAPGAGGGGGGGAQGAAAARGDADGRAALLDEEHEDSADGRAALLDEEHEDSVYGLAWSAADPWLLASMSYDGRVVASHVPKNLKYKILL